MKRSTKSKKKTTPKTKKPKVKKEKIAIGHTQEVYRNTKTGRFEKAPKGKKK